MTVGELNYLIGYKIWWTLWYSKMKCIQLCKLHASTNSSCKTTSVNLENKDFTSLQYFNHSRIFSFSSCKIAVQSKTTLEIWHETFAKPHVKTYASSWPLWGKTLKSHGFMQCEQNKKKRKFLKSWVISWFLHAKLHAKSKYGNVFIIVWPWLATKDHAVALSPLPLLGWGGEWKEKGKTRGLGHG